MIFYFSGTGNSKYTAKKIAELTNDTIFSIADILKSNVLEFDADERVGFVFPVYYFGIPIIVHDFLKRVKFKNIKNKYIYLVLVCEKSTGTTAKSFKNILSTNGIMISSSFSISLPDNYIPMYNVSDMSAAKKWISDSNPRLNEICTGITSRIYGDFDNLKGFFPSLTSALLYPYYKSHRKTKKFFSDSDCNS
ncbi:MAG: EFR1 family ferrodoxin, partial [Clostridia bacterium]